MRTLLEKNIRPRDIMTRSAFEDAITLTMVLGGSTNAVLHLLAMAKSVGVDLTIDDFQRISDATPFLANLKPSGTYVMEDVHRVLGGIPSVVHYLIENKLIKGEHLTVTGLHSVKTASGGSLSVVLCPRIRTYYARSTSPSKAQVIFVCCTATSHQAVR